MFNDELINEIDDFAINTSSYFTDNEMKTTTTTSTLSKGMVGVVLILGLAYVPNSSFNMNNVVGTNIMKMEMNNISETQDYFSCFDNIKEFNKLEFIDGIANEMRYMNDEEIGIWDEVIENIAHESKGIDIKRITLDELGFL